LPITFPHFGSLRYVFEIVLRELGRNDIIIPKKPSKKTFQLGSYYSPEFICTPFKITLGTFIESLEAGADELAMGGTQGTCRFGYYWPVQKLILEDLGYNCKFITFDYHDPLQIVQVFKRISNNYNYCQTFRALRIAWLKNRLTDLTDKLISYYRALEVEKGSTQCLSTEVFNKIVEIKGIKNIKHMVKSLPSFFEKNIEICSNKTPIRVGIIGEIYVVLEPALNLDVFKRLNELGVVCETPISLGKFTDIGAKLNPFKKEHHKIARKVAKPYLPYRVGGDAQESIGDTIINKRKGFDGMVHLYPFTCMPEIISRSILPQISHEYKIPVLSLVVDEQTGEAGFQTRLEAFIDLLTRQKEDDRG